MLPPQFRWTQEVLEAFLDDVVDLGQLYDTSLIREKAQEDDPETQEEDPEPAWSVWFPMKWFSDVLHKKNTLFD